MTVPACAVCWSGTCPSVTFIACWLPSRKTSSRTAEPGLIVPILCASSRESLRAAPSTETITSPAFRPAFAAGLLGCGSVTSAPPTCLRPSASATSEVTGWIWTPSHPRMT